MDRMIEFFRTLILHRRIIKNLQRDALEEGLKEIYVKQGEFGVTWEDNILFRMFFDATIDIVRQTGAKNYLSFTGISKKDGNRYEFLVQRCGAKTPAEKAGEATRLLRDLAELQNGPPLVKYEIEHNEVMERVWRWLEDSEKPAEWKK